MTDHLEYAPAVNLAQTASPAHAQARDHDQEMRLLRGGDQEPLEARFKRLAREWSDGTMLMSSTTDVVQHPAYQEIIRMGKAAVPLLLAALRDEPNHWFWALRIITGENPAPPECRGKVAAMRDAWLAWGRDNGYLCETR